MKNSDIFGYSVYSQFVDEFDNAIERTPHTHPYNYDGFVLYRSGQNKEATATYYSDRLNQWDHEKTDRLCKKHFEPGSGAWPKQSPEKIEAFLSEWVEKPVKVILIMEYCNQASGYPVWRIDVKTS